MPKSLLNLPAFTSLLLFTLLFASYEMAAVMVEGKICDRRSKTWTGWCGNSSHCDQKCHDWEGARHGSCHYGFSGWGCFCYFNC